MKNNIFYCDTCDGLTTCTMKKIKEVCIIKGVKITAKVIKIVCNDCNHYIDDYNIVKQNDIIINDKYRKKVKLLTSKKIKKIRDSYGMSQTEFSFLLGIKLNDIKKYEEGAIQTREIDQLIRKLSKAR